MKPFKNFIFVGGNELNFEQNQERIVLSNLEPGNILLSNAKVNQLVKIKQMEIDHNTCSYLSNLGFKVGAVVGIVSKTATNSFLVVINDKQVGLGEKIAQKIVVNFVNRVDN